MELVRIEPIIFRSQEEYLWNSRMEVIDNLLMMFVWIHVHWQTWIPIR